ncbi:MAG: hypothetical protein GY804_00230 [Alphaproteobacteria bacterium]|nr:hypothetical protein [Alphaproteobacteria bacterium]
MTTSHDNFYVTTLIDRSTGESARVRDLANHTNTSRLPFAATTTTDDIGLTGIYAYTGTAGATLTLSTALLNLGTATKPYLFTVSDEGGNTTTNNLTIDTEGGEFINGTTSATLNSNYSQIDIYTNGTAYFSDK